ncbi:MAG: protein kinase [Myxococcota bacterium]
MLAGLSGTVLEQRYELGRVLGSGGMGAVFEARHLRLDRPVAIKVLRPAYATEGEYIERFLREAKAASKIRHRNVVEILDYGEAAGGLVYSVMEFLVGQDLQQLLQSQPQGRLSWARAYGLLVQIASGLKAAHGQGVIHRDIKPANCFLTDEDGEPVVKLVDFGIARLEGGERGHTLTGTAQVLGTPSYIAPELVRTPQPASPQSDVYALGVLAYRMLAGKVPFAAGTVFELLRVACFEPVPSLRAHVPGLPAPVEALVLEMLAKEPEGRPADMLAVRQRLVALGRRTLGAQAVELPGSSALPLSIGDVARPRWSTEDTTVPRDGAGEGWSPPVGEGRTEVVVVPRPEGAESGLVWPGPPAAGVVASGQQAGQQAGQQTAQYADSSPSRSATTVPSVGESTLQSLEASGALERPRRRGGVWLALGMVGALAVAGGLIVPAVFGDDALAVDSADGGRAARAEAEVAAEAEAEAEVKAEAGDELLRSRRHADGSELATASANHEGSSGGDELVILDDDEVVLDELGLGEIEPRGTALPHGPKGSHRKTKGKTDPETEPESKPKPESTTNPKTKPKPEFKTKPESKTEPRPKTKPPGPPADATLAKKLQRQIKSRCARSMDGRAVTVKFVVTPSGGMMGLTASPAGAAAQCAKVQVQGTKFRPRSKSAPLKITAE